MRRGARSFRSSRRQSSNMLMSIHESALLTPMRSAKRRMDSGCIASPPDSRQCIHARIIPAVNEPALNQFDQLALAHHAYK